MRNEPGEGDIRSDSSQLPIEWTLKDSDLGSSRFLCTAPKIKRLKEKGLVTKETGTPSLPSELVKLAQPPSLTVERRGG